MTAHSGVEAFRGTGKRERILRAAVEVFAQRGYFNAKVSEIARMAGVADGTIYLYFQRKEDLLITIFRDHMTDYLRRLHSRLEHSSRPVDQLRQIVLFHLETLGNDRSLAIVFQVELRGSIKFMQEFSATGFAEYLDIIRATIDEGQRSGVLRSDVKPIVCAKMFYGALDEMVTNWILSSKSYPLAPMADEVLKVFFGGLLVK